MAKVINSFRGPNAFLSNFYEHQFRWRGRVWWTSEHAFQAAKTRNMEDVDKIMRAPSPSWAKRFGRQVELRPNWEKVKRKAMYSILKAKFSDPAMAKKLLATGNAVLIEGNNWGDRYWGQVNGKGENHLGKLLMRVRKELRAKKGKTTTAGILTVVASPSKQVKQLAKMIHRSVQRNAEEIKRRQGNLFRWMDHDQYPAKSVYIGRLEKPRQSLPCPRGRNWGNPFKLANNASDDERNQCIRKYRNNLLLHLAGDILKGRETLLLDLSQLCGHHLVCHCAPKACHGHVLSTFAAWARIKLNEMWIERRSIVEIEDMLAEETRGY